MNNMEEVMHAAYLTARSFQEVEPPAGALYIGSRFWRGERYRYWIGEDGTLYQESSGEAALKKKIRTDFKAVSS